MPSVSDELFDIMNGLHKKILEAKEEVQEIYDTKHVPVDESDYMKELMGFLQELSEDVYDAMMDDEEDEE